MPEHFIARMRGLWLSYPDGSVITARARPPARRPPLRLPESTDVGPPVTDARTRRATLGAADRTLGTRPLVLSHPPDTGHPPGRRDGRYRRIARQPDRLRLAGLSTGIIRP